MPLNRYFLDTTFQAESDVTLADVEAHHLLNVTRTTLGDTIELTNGKNQLALAKVLKIEKGRVLLHVVQVDNFTLTNNKIILAQALCRFNRLDTILEKGTELGVSEFWIYTTERSEKIEISPSQEKRMSKICINAMKQCGRLDLPKIEIKPPLLQWKEIPKPAFFGDLKSDQLLKPMHNPFLLIGPEGGFSEKEREFLLKHGVQGVKLHANVLRVDTAAIVGVALLHETPL